MIPAERSSEQRAKASGALDESRLSAQNLDAMSLGSWSTTGTQAGGRRRWGVEGDFLRLLFCYIDRILPEHAPIIATSKQIGGTGWPLDVKSSMELGSSALNNPNLGTLQLAMIGTRDQRCA